MNKQTSTLNNAEPKAVEMSLDELDAVKWRRQSWRYH